MTFRLDKIDSLFPTPLVHFTLTDHLALNAPLVDEIAVRRAAEPGVSRTNRLGWHSETDLFERPEPAQAALAKALKAPGTGSRWPSMPALRRQRKLSRPAGAARRRS